MARGGRGGRRIILQGWSSEHNAVAFWVGDLAQPGAPVVEPVGTMKDGTEFKIGPGGRFYVSVPGKVLVYSLGASGFHRDRTFPFPEYGSAPRIAISTQGNRFVPQCFRSKLVYGGNTETGAVLGPWNWEIGEVNDVAIAADGLTAAAGGSSKKLVVWDLE